MVPQCYVDGDVADWAAEDEDLIGCDITAVIVYHPEITKKAFERSCDWLEDRIEARRQAILELVSSQGRKLGLVDRELLDEANRIVDEDFGEDYLDRFIQDTEMVALDRIGSAFSAAASEGLRIMPPTARAAVEVIPSKSFRTEKALGAYLSEGRASWKPGVRLTFSASLDGARAIIERHAAALRMEVSECGPVTEWRQRLRAGKGEKTASGTMLRLVVR